jgi:hypothetical protein
MVANVYSNIKSENHPKRDDNLGSIPGSEGHAEAVRENLRKVLLEVIRNLNDAKIHGGLNVDFALQKGPDGLFIMEPKIKITKDM